MKAIYKLLFLFTAACLSGPSCKKQLDVKNPNQPNPETLKTEDGIIGYALGGVYDNGFRAIKYGPAMGESFLSFVNGFHGLLGDEVSAEAANNYANQVGCPDKVILDNGTSVPNPGTPNRSTLVLRAVNLNASADSNPVYYEWAWMYSLNNACNVMLEYADIVSFSGDAATKQKVLKAWAYWWKGYAYGRIGSMYYAGLIRSSSSLKDPEPDGDYVANSAIITESNLNYDKAISILNTQSLNDTYTATLAKMIPDFCQVGKGLPPDPGMWIRNINTMKARNILVNKTASSMTASDWTAIVALTTSGLQSGDYVFTARSNATGDFISTGGGSVPALSASQDATPVTAGLYKISERLVQDYKAGDQRKANNFLESAPYLFNIDRGNAFHTRFGLKSGGFGVADAIVYTNNEVAGASEYYLAGTWEENQLMLGEATMYANSFSPASINTAMALIDAVRVSQGAGLAAVAGVVTTQAEALEELRKERRSGLVFRGLVFYDARRWKVIDPLSSGGGRTGCNLVDNSGVLNTNATIDYNYLDYWDVPDNELAYNPPGAGSYPVVNPRQ